MEIDRNRIKPFGSPFIGFGGEQVYPMGIISMPLIARTALKVSSEIVDFLVVNRPFAYNAIIGRPELNKLRATTSTYHLMMKFPTEEEVGEVKGDQLAVRRYYNISLKKVSDSTTLTVASVTKVKGGTHRTTRENGCRRRKGPTDWEGSQEIQEGLVDFLRKNLGVFAWSHEDMPGINSEVIVHVLNVDPDMKPVK